MVSTELRDLEGILRTNLGSDFRLLDYKTEPLIPKGENYASTILKVDVRFDYGGNSEPRVLNLVGKTVQLTSFHDRYFNSTLSVTKEIFVYQHLMPRYRKLELELLNNNEGDDENKIANLVPKYYGGRLSVNPESKVADEDSLILLQNLTPLGYQIMDRKKGLDLAHSRLAMKQLARYHALGIAIRSKDPGFFHQALPAMKPPVLNLSDDFEYVIDYTRASVCSDPRISRFTESIAKAFRRGWEAITLDFPENPWFTFTHGDFWVNNLLYLHDETGSSIKDLKLIDFQFPTYTVCMADIPYMACCSTDPEVLEHHLDLLLDDYYEIFIKTLTELRCDEDGGLKPYTREGFDQELKKVANCQLFNCIVGIKFFTFDVEGDFDINDVMSVVLMADVTDLFKDRICTLILKYAEKGWL